MVFAIGEGEKINTTKVVLIYIFVLFVYYVAMLVYKYLKLFNYTSNEIWLLDNNDKNNQNLAIKDPLKEVSLYVIHSL